MEKITFKKSLYAKLVLARGLALDAYQMIKDVCSTHESVVTKMTFDHEVAVYEKTKVALFRVSRKNLYLYLPLNPKTEEKFGAIDVSQTQAYKNYPCLIVVDTQKALKNAIKLLEKSLKKAKATTICEAEDIDYSEVLFERDFDVLLKEGYIKKYIRTIIDGEEVAVELEEDVHKVTFTAKLMYEAVNKADKLFIITSFTDWNLADAIPMEMIDENTFKAVSYFPVNTNFEFKVCKSESWEDVEKGIWKEEIVNHTCSVEADDVNVEDLIYNFRNN